MTVAIGEEDRERVEAFLEAGDVDARIQAGSTLNLNQFVAGLANTRLTPRRVLIDFDALHGVFG